MKKVRAKKHLGQHFLTQPGIADDIANGIADKDGVKNVLEIGPGSGILTRAIMAREGINLKLIELDSESVEHLYERHPELGSSIIAGDFLKMDLTTVF